MHAARRSPRPTTAGDTRVVRKKDGPGTPSRWIRTPVAVLGRDRTRLARLYPLRASLLPDLHLRAQLFAAARSHHPAAARTRGSGRSPAGALPLKLRIRLARGLGDLLWRGQLRGIPTAPQGLHQLHRTRHLLDLQAVHGLLVAEYGVLQRDHIDVGIDAGLIPAHLQIERGLRRRHRGALLLDLLRKYPCL